MKIMKLKIIKHPIYNNLLIWFRILYKISNDNTYTYNSDTKSGPYKKKKKISLILSEQKKKNLIEFENLSLFMSNWDFFSHKTLGQNNQ